MRAVRAAPFSWNAAIQLGGPSVDVAIKQVGQRNAADRFVLVDVKTRRVITQNDASAEAIERFFRKRGVSAATIQSCLNQARQKFRAQHAPPARPPVDEASETIEDDSLLFELGLDGDDPSDN